MQDSAQQDQIIYYQQCRERASQRLEDMIEELTMKHGYESYCTQLRGPLIDLITAHLLTLNATIRLGGPETIAYGIQESDAALIKKIGRLILDDGQQLFEPAEMALARCKLPKRAQREIHNEWVLSRGMFHAKPRLHCLTTKLAKRGRKISHAALDRFVDQPERFW
ncbi:hypothetical protein [Pusillimonas sp. ANT_WB101]|uniref:hypothetical protein n=1 Tax=Pusillimonas sp. ANT_WB101 TaxID=2597356 RepID=UPI0011EC798F|nr:hypothetical protein [Pusillimonas sp. ANT_WB101]KAA0911463.1 hypothetical protein FQ179_06455 [Pusillimonas sp. ANT_WB101]